MVSVLELEYGRMNIGTHPSKQRPSGGIESLRQDILRACVLHI